MDDAGENRAAGEDWEKYGARKAREANAALIALFDTVFSEGGPKLRGFRDAIVGLCGQGKEIRAAIDESLRSTDWRRRLFGAHLAVQLGEVGNDGSASRLGERAKLEFSREFAADDAEHRLLAVLLATRIGLPPPLDALLERALRDSDGRVRTLAAVALVRGGSAGPAHLRMLQAGLVSGEPTIVGACAGALAGIRGDGIAASQFGVALREATPAAQHGMLMTLRDLGSSGATFAPCLAEFARSVDHDVRSRGEAIEALVVVTPESGVAETTLQWALRSTEVPLVLGALDGVAQSEHASEESVSLLGPLLSHREGRVRAAAVKAVGALGPKAAALSETLVSVLRKTEATDELHPLAQAMARVGRSVAEALRAAMECDPVQERLLVMGAMACMGAEGAKALAELISGDADEHAKVSAIGLLFHMGPDAISAYPTLAEVLLSTLDPDIAVAVMVTLCVHPSHAVVALPGLIRALITGPSEVAWYAAETLKKIGSPALPMLEEAWSELEEHDRAPLAPVLEFIRAGAGDPLVRFQRVDRSNLQRFVLVAEMLSDGVLRSRRSLAKSLQRKQSEAKIDPRLALTENSLRLACEHVEVALGAGPLIRAVSRRGIELTKRGRIEFEDARRFLAR